jgi:hypothetical protein
MQCRRGSRDLRITPQGRQPLDKEQQKFNHLLVRLDKLKLELR